jgi:ferric-dicitrate binding protein FerR (iron transport regulator)
MDEELATRRLEKETATRRMERTERRAAPAPAPPPRVRAEPAPARAPRRSPLRRMLRGMGALIVLVLIAAAVALGVIAATSDEAGVRLRDVGGDTVNEVVNQIEELVNDNTQ